MNCGALVLCGGESRRMGEPKAWLPFGRERMLQRVVRLVGTTAEPVVVVAGPDQELPPLPSAVRIARDSIQGAGRSKVWRPGWPRSTHRSSWSSPLGRTFRC